MTWQITSECIDNRVTNDYNINENISKYFEEDLMISQIKIDLYFYVCKLNISIKLIKLLKIWKKYCWVELATKTSLSLKW